MNGSILGGTLAPKDSVDPGTRHRTSYAWCLRILSYSHFLGVDGQDFTHGDQSRIWKFPEMNVGYCNTSVLAISSFSRKFPEVGSKIYNEAIGTTKLHIFLRQSWFHVSDFFWKSEVSLAGICNFSVRGIDARAVTLSIMKRRNVEWRRIHWLSRKLRAFMERFSDNFSYWTRKICSIFS
jgi:hypothetical protein